MGRANHRIISFIFICCYPILFAPASGFSKGKVGYINIQRLVYESILGKLGNAEIETFKVQSNNEIRERRLVIEALDEKLKKEKLQKPIDEIKIKELARTLKFKQKHLARFIEDVSDGITGKEKHLLATILARAEPILEKLAKDKNYALILKNSANLAYLDPRVDLTGQIIKTLDKKSASQKQPTPQH